MSTLEKTSQELWNDYYFLTKEMAKFLEKQDMDIFSQLMEQRESLQRLIDDAKDDGFSVSATGRELLQNIQRANQNVVLKLQYLVNTNRNQNNVSRAYDGLGSAISGRRMDRQT